MWISELAGLDHEPGRGCRARTCSRAGFLCRNKIIQLNTCTFIYIVSIYQSLKSSNQLRLARFFCFQLKKMSSESWIQWIIIKSHWCFTIYTAECYHSETLPLSSCSFCTIVQTVFFRREHKRNHSRNWKYQNRPRIKQHERCKFPDFKYITYLLTVSPLLSSHVPFSFTTLTFFTCSDLVTSTFQAVTVLFVSL